MREGSKHFIKSIYFIISKYFDQIKWKILGSWFKNNTMKGLTLFKIIKFSLQSVNQTIFFYEKLKVGPAHHSFQTRLGPRPGSRVLAGSPGSIFFKSKQRCFSKNKKQKSTGRNRVFYWVLPSQTSFFFPYLFFNLARFQPRVGQDPGDPLSRAGF